MRRQESDGLAEEDGQQRSFDVERWVAASRARQGFGPRIEDKATIARLVVLAGLSEGGGRDAGAAP